MLPAYTLVVDIVDLDPTTPENIFREEVSLYLGCLDALKGSFDRSPCKKTFYQKSAEDEEYEPGCWAVRAVVMISLGKQRAEYLTELYRFVTELIEVALPSSYEIKCEVNKFQFS